MVDLVVATSILFVLTVGLTTALWFWLSRTMRRNIDDVTRSLKIDLIENHSSNLKVFVDQLDRLPRPVEPDISPLADRLLQLEEVVASATQLATERQKALHAQLDELTESVDNIPYPLGPKPVDLGPVYERFQSIEAQLASLEKVIYRAASNDLHRAGR